MMRICIFAKLFALYRRAGWNLVNATRQAWRTSAW